VDLEQLLASVPLTAGLEDRVRRRLAGIGRVRAYPSGTTIVEEGATATALYIVVTGRARIVRGGETIGEVVRGDFFGELALIEEHPRSATVIADEDTECLLFPAWEFTALLAEHPELAVPIMRALIARLHKREQHET
jgi:CRP/FNR family transcriptional regulator